MASMMAARARDAEADFRTLLGNAGNALADLAVWLQDHFVLPIVNLAAVPVFVVILANDPASDETSGDQAFKWKLAVAIVAAISALLSALAARRVGSLQKATLQNLLIESAKTVSAFLPFLEQTHEVAFLSGAAKRERIRSLRVAATIAAARIPLGGEHRVRASYYPLETDPDGYRTLVGPTVEGRLDNPVTEFVERDDPHHPIWRVIDGSDLDVNIYKYGERVEGVNWDERPYKVFVSVPVKAKKATFGLLSVNSTDETDIQEHDRIAIIGLARAMATVLAHCESPKSLEEMARD